MYGIIAFYDILGYQNIIDNNEIDDITNIVTEILMKIPNEVKEELIDKLEPYDDTKKVEPIKTSLSLIESKLISDSIFTHMSIEGVDDFARFFIILSFLVYARNLTTKLFENGLPVRGAISIGEYFTNEQCLAGKPIINSYRDSESLEFSGVVMKTETFNKILDYAVYDDENMTMYFMNILTKFYAPTKSGNKNFHLLNWIPRDNEIIDVRQYVYDAFRKHNKDIPKCVYPKIENTEITIREFLYQNRNNSEPKHASDGKNVGDVESAS